MYSKYDDDDDCDSMRTRGQDLHNRLRAAVQATSKIQDESARDAVSELIEAMRLISDVLYDLCEPPKHRLNSATPPSAHYSLS